MDPPSFLGDCSAGIDHLDPILAPVGGGKVERQLFVVRIEHNQEAVVTRASRRAFGAHRRAGAAVKEDGSSDSLAPCRCASAGSEMTCVTAEFAL
jgi:hypothetical protein